MKAAPDPAELETRWKSRGLSFSDLEVDSDGTLVASDRHLVLADSATLYAADHAGEAGGLVLSPEAFVLDGPIGRGGMGEVRAARQPSLRRGVAIKTVTDAENGAATAALLKEAWVGAALAHPHMVPVHTLARVGRAPALVMKKVEGRSWSETAPNASLEDNLRVLIQVCHALSFAHSRAILHLDLKPDNVMVGAYGEVYVLDWGLAARLDGGPEWLAPASAIRGVAGTPAYMAPELAAADGDRVDARTDVYLAGGLLHFAITGRPLHEGEDLAAVLRAAFAGDTAPLPDDVPAELRAIHARATAREPDDRFGDVSSLGDALEGFLRHRHADRFVDAAREIARGDETRIDASRLAEWEQALLRARRSWAAHPELPALERAFLERSARHAIARGRLEEAEAFVGRIDEAPGALLEDLERLRASVAARRERVEELEVLGRELDFTLGTRQRRRIFVALGAVWLAVSLVLGWVTRTGLHTIGYEELLIEGGLLVVTLLPYGWLRRKAIFTNRANGRLYGGLILTAASVQLFWFACMRLGVESLVAVAITPLFYAYAWATLAIVLDRRLWWGTLPMIGAAVGSALEPTWTFELIGVAGGAAVALTARAWREGAVASTP